MAWHLFIYLASCFVLCHSSSLFSAASSHLPLLREITNEWMTAPANAMNIHGPCHQTHTNNNGNGNRTRTRTRTRTQSKATTSPGQKQKQKQEQPQEQEIVYKDSSYNYNTQLTQLAFPLNAATIRSAISLSTSSSFSEYPSNRQDIRRMPTWLGVHSEVSLMCICFNWIGWDLKNVYTINEPPNMHQSIPQCYLISRQQILYQHLYKRNSKNHISKINSSRKGYALFLKIIIKINLQIYKKHIDSQKWHTILNAWATKKSLNVVYICFSNSWIFKHFLDWTGNIFLLKMIFSWV